MTNTPREPMDSQRIIAIANQKGGVGKTTTTLTLGAALTERGRSVLLVDLDPQSSLTIALGVNAEGNSLHEVLGSTVFEVTEPGLFTAVQGERRLHLAVGLSNRDVSFLNRSRFRPDETSAVAGLPTELSDEGERSEELWIFLILAAVCLLIVEWWTYHRRLTV